MYKLFLTFSLISVTICTAMMDDESDYQMMAAPEPRPKGSRHTMMEAQKLIAKYKETATPQELEKVINYLTYYRSWYQAVSPAPADSYKQMSPNSKKLVNQLRELGDRFIVKPEKMMPGSSRLSPEGDNFYQTAIEELKAGTMTIKGRHSPYAVRLPAHGE